MKFLILSTTLFLSLFLFNCSERKETNNTSKLEIKMNSIAENYVKLALQIGKYDTDFVDTYFGPDNLKPKDDNSVFNQSVFEELKKKVDDLLDQMETLVEFPANKIEIMRYSYLYKQLLACKTKIYMLNGMELTFSEELNALYDIEDDYKDEKYFDNFLNQLDSILPGQGDINQRYISFREQFVVPENKLKIVFNTAINECRKRTNKFIKLPTTEKFEIQFVKNKPWSAYNWFKGNSFSLIEINTDLPIYVDRIVDLAAHEGYPGHHVHHSMMEWHLYKKRNWIEFSIYLLFSPQSVIAEGIASYGPELLFPDNERIKFEKQFIFPQAELDTSKVDLYYEVMNIVNQLNPSVITATKNYLDGIWDESKTIKWLQKYNLRTEDSAKKLLEFIKRYRAYVANYSVGYNLVKSNLQTKKTIAEQWNLLRELMSYPITPSSIEQINDEN